MILTAIDIRPVVEGVRFITFAVLHLSGKEPDLSDFGIRRLIRRISASTQVEDLETWALIFSTFRKPHFQESLCIKKRSISTANERGHYT